jgi:hypothetical protein
MRRLLLAAAVALGLAAPAQADAPATSPFPEPNPRVTAVIATSGSGVGAEIARRAALKPRERPAELAVPAIALGGVSIATLAPKARPPEPEPEPVAAVVAQQPAATVSVLPRLAANAPPARPRVRRADNPEELVEVAAGAVRAQPAPETTVGKKGSVCGDRAIRGTSIPRIVGKIKGCGLEDGVKVTSVDGVELSTPITVDCTTAKALKAWVRDGIKPAVGKAGGGVARLEVAASYACRPRNNQPGAKISEHGRGRAVDISAVVLANGKVISVLRDWGEGKAGKILASARRAACGPFGTVLGPGSDKFHRDHFHVDTARYRSGHYCK